MSKGDLAGCRALVADDDPMMRRVMARWLARGGLNVDVVGDGQAALEQLRAGDYELLVSDIDMPGISGIELVRRLRASPQHADLGVLLVTGDTSHDVHVTALHLGVDDFVAKPFEGAVLQARVRNVVARRRAERATAQMARRLARYVSSAARRPRERGKDVEMVDVTILFSDLRGFTSTSEVVDAIALFDALNQVLAKQVEVICHRGGDIDKFSGDGLMAVFEGDDAASRACCAAADIVAWAQQAGGIGPWSPAPIGFGIHTGTVARGDLGGLERKEFTVIGAPVNTAARLCGVAEALQVIVSEPVVAAARQVACAKALAFQRHGDIPLKGMQDPTTVFRVTV